MQRYGKIHNIAVNCPQIGILHQTLCAPSAELYAALVQVAPYPQHIPFSHPKDKVIK